MYAKQDKEPQRHSQLRAKEEAMLADPAQASESYHQQHYDELLHKLHTHQIELEMQNEELRRASVALETSRAQYLELYDFAPVTYLNLTAEGMIAEINLTGAKLFGVERKKLINRRFSQFIVDEDKVTWYRFFLLARQHDGKQSCELTLVPANGTPLIARLNCICTRELDGPPQLRVVIDDISEQKQAEAELRITAVAFEAQEGIIVTDANKIILRANQAFTRITGYSAEEVIGQTPAFLNSGRHDEDFYYDLWATVVADGHWQGETWDKRKNGEIFPVWLNIAAVTNVNGCITHFVGSFSDITSNKLAEQVLLEARQHLENQVATTKEELDKIKEETAEINIALNVLLKQRTTEKSDAQIALSQEVKETILPFLKKLKGTSTGRIQTTRLINILETNLLNLVKEYGFTAHHLPAINKQLTPVERQVASMIRQGLGTKVIAATLNCSSGTVCVHRKHIRKKLGLNSKASNLYSYLQSLTE